MNAQKSWQKKLSMRCSKNETKEWKKKVIQKIKNMKKTEEALRDSISDAQTAVGIIQNTRELLENELSDKTILL